MKILVTGANGLLGQHLTDMLLKEGKFTVVATGRGKSWLSFETNPNWQYEEMDITNNKKVEKVLAKHKPSIIIHCAAITQVDDCELNRTRCWKTNVAGTRFLLKASSSFSPFFIFVSTDFIFDGLHGPYDESSQPNPVNTYGESKLLAEEMVLMSGLPCAIVRTVLLYVKPLAGRHRNFILWVKENLEQHAKMRIVDDQLRSPTYVRDLAKGILLVILRRAQGIYHISGKDMMSPYQLALGLSGLLGLDSTNIERANAATFSQPAKRPPVTGFIIDKAMKELGYVPHSFEDGVRQMFG